MNRSDSSCGKRGEESVHFIRPKKARKRVRFWLDEEQAEEVGGISDDEDGHEPILGGDQDAEEEYGERKPQRVQDPKPPTKEERKEHEMTHMPFRSWCRHCVRGRGKEEPCRAAGEEPREPEVHVDFMFMGEESGGKVLTVLVAKEKSRRQSWPVLHPLRAAGIS